MRKKRRLFCLSARIDEASGGLHTYRRTQDIALSGNTLHHSVFVWFLFFSLAGGTFCLLEVSTGRPKEVPNAFHLKRDVPGRKRGPIKKGRVDPHAAEGGGLHSDLVSASTVKAQQRTGRTVGPFVLTLWLVFDGSVIEWSTHRTREDSLL